MAEDLILPLTEDKEEKYRSLLPQVAALINEESNLTANLANVCAALKQSMDFFWVGFYLKEDNQLVLGPFQGPVACTRIALDKGVCGAAYQRAASVLVPDVNEFPGHIACSSNSKSEIVVPVFKGKEVAAVLDIDSHQLNDFDATDQQYLEQLAAMLSGKF
jgi:L-methionine (R)-S-oxide reductase